MSESSNKYRIDIAAFLSIIRPQNCVIGGLTVIAGIAIAYTTQWGSGGPGLPSILDLFVYSYLTYFFVRYIFSPNRHKDRSNRAQDAPCG